MAVGYYATLVPVTIVVDGQARSVRTNQRSVDNILREAGIKIEADDIVGPTLGSSLADDQSTIIVQHARPVTVQADGQTQQFQSQTSQLPEILKQAEVGVHEFDRVTVNGQILVGASTGHTPPRSARSIAYPHRHSTRRAGHADVKPRRRAED
jgi:uncharacterized protein YabE (DUF348 family)